MDLFRDSSQLDVSLRVRLQSVVAAFTTRFSDDRPHFVARAPGRVNLVGEHIDYCGYSVLPMAIERDVVMAASLVPDSDLVTLSNVDANRYPEVSLSKNVAPSIEFGEEGPSWYHYFICGFRGVLEALGLKASVGFRVMVDGNIPPSAGLSSSSAMVCCGSLVTLWANAASGAQDWRDPEGVVIDRHWLADLCKRSERYIGTQGGGMDQAICFLAEEGKAKRVDFDPLAVTDVVLPKGSEDGKDGAVFVVANSCVVANKAAFADFNVRVVECRLAARMLAKHCRLEGWFEMTKLKNVQTACGASSDDMLRLVDDIFRDIPYGKNEVMAAMETSETDFDTKCLTPNTRHVRTFALRDRAAHVFSEAARVDRFQAVCDETSGSGDDDEDRFRRLGALMNESHASCRDAYHCSCAELDELVEACRKVDSPDLGLLCYGARLTGAGWGGCAVALVKKRGLDQFLSSLEKVFYSPRDFDFAKSVIPSKPGQGAFVTKLE